MPLLSPAALGRRFRALSARERRAFLAALWDRRGYETRIEDDVVVAVDGDGSEERRIGVVGLLSRSIPDDADAVVATRDHDRLRGLAADADAEYYGPAALRDLLAYGVSRDAGDALARDHLGTPLSVPDRETASGIGPVGGVAGAVALLLIVGTVLTLAGVGVPVGDDATADSGTVGSAANDVTTRTPSTPESTPSSSAEATPDDDHAWAPFAPGVTESGVDEPGTLIEAHRSLTAGTDRDYRLVYDGPPGDPLFGEVNRTVVAGQINAPDNTFTEVVTVRSGPNGSRTVVRDEHRVSGDSVDSRRTVEVGNASRTEPPAVNTRVAQRYESGSMALLADGLRVENDSARVDATFSEPLVVVHGTADEHVVAGRSVSNVTLFATFTQPGRLVDYRLSYEAEGATGRTSLTFRYDREGLPPPDERDDAED